VFSDSMSKDFNARFARLAVLYEDLSLEISGMVADGGALAALERHSDAYRKHYFARRAIGTLSEFAEAVKRLSDTPDFGKFASAFDQEQSRAWNAATKFLDENRVMIDKVRNDVGGHFGEAASRYAVEQMDGESSISLTIETDISRSKRLKVGFAGDFAATALLRHAPGGDPSERARFVFELLLQGLKYVMEVEYAVFGPSVWHKLGR
jgi:hypothetical protein